MCGIAAILDKDINTPKLEYIHPMLDMLAHRGPDGEGVYIKQNIALGHRRLAILDIDNRSKQPMERANLSLIFNGLIFNYIELKEELHSLGYEFETTSDTEVILAAYSEWGLSAFSRFNGMWAIILHDLDQNQLICSRDRFGIKPLYYTEIGNQILWASEIKAFTKHTAWQANINHERVYEYLAYNMHDHTTETMFQGVHQVPRGCHMIVDLSNNEYNTQSYYTLDKGNESDPSEMMDMLQDAISKRTRSDVSYACTLSGGLDSSTVVSTMADKLDLQPEVFSLKFKEPEVDESAYAAMVSEKYQLRQHWVKPNIEELISTLDKHLQIQDEPFNGTTVIAQHAIYEQIADRGHKVSIGGQGGDEIFCGYEKFIYHYYKSLKSKPVLLSKELLLFAKHNPVPWSMIWDRYSHMIKSNKGEKASWYKAKLHNSRLFTRPSENSIFEVSKNLLSNLGISALLRYEDRNSMVNGIESRLPFLDYRLVEYAVNLTDDEKIKNGRTKALVRDKMKGIVPQSIIDRKDKMGLETPQEQWLNDPKLIQYVSDHIDELPFLNKNAILRKIKSDQKFMWRVLSLIRWMKIYKVTS